MPLCDFGSMVQGFAGVCSLQPVFTPARLQPEGKAAQPTQSAPWTELVYGMVGRMAPQVVPTHARHLPSPPAHHLPQPPARARRVLNSRDSKANDPGELEQLDRWCDLEEDFEHVSMQAWYTVVAQVRARACALHFARWVRGWVCWCV